MNTASLFADVVGQPAAVAALTAAARAPVHAYLFLGPPGSGRRAAARAFAAALLCPSGGCGECDDCRLALAGRHPDQVLVQRSGAALSVDEARHLVSLAQRRPYQAARQVLVLPDAHLAVRAAPALLKTLEEPPATTVFVVLADAVPPELTTVASRCVTVPFSPVPAAEVARWLAGRGVAGETAEQVAQGCGGDLDRARLLAEDPGFGQRMTLWRSVPSRLDGTGGAVGTLAAELTEATESALGPIQAEHARQLETLSEEASARGERGLPGRKEITDRHHREERRWRTEELRAGLAVLAREYRDRLLEKLATQDAAADRRAVDLLTEIAGSLRHNPNQRLLLEGLLVRLSEL